MRENLAPLCGILAHLSLQSEYGKKDYGRADRHPKKDKRTNAEGFI